MNETTVYSLYEKSTHEWVMSLKSRVRAMLMLHDLTAEAGKDYILQKEYYTNGKLMCWETEAQ